MRDEWRDADENGKQHHGFKLDFVKCCSLSEWEKSERGTSHRGSIYYVMFSLLSHEHQIALSSAINID